MQLWIRAVFCGSLGLAFSSVGMEGVLPDLIWEDIDSLGRKELRLHSSGDHLSN